MPYGVEANFKLMHTSSYVTTAQQLARALYVVLFDPKPLNEDSNCMAGMYALYACAKRRLTSPQNTLQSM